jgi:5-methyltetrahydrofolate--homocysteine methyltransferase
MVASSNSVTDYVPLANMKAMFDATFEFGQYPIELREGGVKGRVWKYLGKSKIKAESIRTELNVSAYAHGLLSNKMTEVIALCQRDVAAGVPISDVISKGMIPAMAEVGSKFQKGEIYIPEMMIAAKAMSCAIDHFKGDLIRKTAGKRGKVVIGTVRGDLHDIGKNLVAMMLKGQGFEVDDLGVSVSPEAFADAVVAKKPHIVALSALLTTTMMEMANTIKALDRAGVRKQVIVIAGGAPVTEKFALGIGADGWAYDAPGAAEKCKQLLKA